MKFDIVILSLFCWTSSSDLIYFILKIRGHQVRPTIACCNFKYYTYLLPWPAIVRTVRVIACSLLPVYTHTHHSDLTSSIVLAPTKISPPHPHPHPRVFVRYLWCYLCAKPKLKQEWSKWTAYEYIQTLTSFINADAYSPLLRLVREVRKMEKLPLYPGKRALCSDAYFDIHYALRRV